MKKNWRVILLNKIALFLIYNAHAKPAKNLGLPQNYREAFVLLENAGLLPLELSLRMQKMVGFRNIAIHAYQDIELPILQNILQHHLIDFKDFVRVVLAL